MKLDFIKSRLSLIVVGVGLGWLARIVLGAPAEELGPPRSIDRPVSIESDEVIDLPIINRNVDDEASETGLVPPIQLPGTLAILGAASPISLNVLFDEQSHDADAAFEAHGHQQCASGCAISRHPTAELTSKKFDRLLKNFASGPLEDTNQSLEELIYFGAQTRKLIESQGVGELDNERAKYLWDQLTYTHAKVSIRVKDEQGKIRTWIEPTRVPFDRRHVFSMKTDDVQPLVTSGTVKRVGLNHLWARL